LVTAICPGDFLIAFSGSYHCPARFIVDRFGNGEWNTASFPVAARRRVKGDSSAILYFTRSAAQASSVSTITRSSNGGEVQSMSFQQIPPFMLDYHSATDRSYTALHICYTYLKGRRTKVKDISVLPLLSAAIASRCCQSSLLVSLRLGEFPLSLFLTHAKRRFLRLLSLSLFTLVILSPSFSRNSFHVNYSFVESLDNHIDIDITHFISQVNTLKVMIPIASMQPRCTNAFFNLLDRFSTPRFTTKVARCKGLEEER